MGANNVLPVIPPFTGAVPAIGDLNALSYAASFIIDHGVRPAWKFFSTATHVITAGGWTVVPFNNVAYDSDGVYVSANNSATIVTQGYYEIEACIPLVAGANKDSFGLSFEWSPTSSNPYFSSGPLNFGWKENSLPQTGSAAADSYLCISAITPFPMYPQDALFVNVYSNAARTLDYNQNTSFSQGRFSCQFTGRWARSGS